MQLQLSGKNYNAVIKKPNRLLLLASGTREVRKYQMRAFSEERGIKRYM